MTGLEYIVTIYKNINFNVDTAFMNNKFAPLEDLINYFSINVAVSNGNVQESKRMIRIIK